MVEWGGMCGEGVSCGQGDVQVLGQMGSYVTCDWLMTSWVVVT